MVDLQSVMAHLTREAMFNLRVTRSLSRRVGAVRRRLWRLDSTRPRVHSVGGLPLIVLPGVFDGVLIRTGAFLAQVMVEQPLAASARVLDLGCGSGIGAIAAAARGAPVIATDINPEAVRNTQINALAVHLQDQIETRVGDLFEPVGDERFDLILFNPPYYRGRPRTPADHAWRSLDAFDRFLAQLPAHLTPGGRALVVLSTDGDIGQALAAARALAVRAVGERNFINEKITVYEIKVAARDANETI